MIRKTLFILLCFSIIYTLKAQSTISEDSLEKKYYPHRVILKMYPQYRNEVSSETAVNTGLLEVFIELGVTNIEMFFNNAKSLPENSVRNGKKMVDLSLIYEIYYSNDFSVEDAIQKIQKTGMVEYAEPHYKQELFYIPNDPYAQPGIMDPDTSQFYLSIMKAYEAWDVEKGDTNVVIGIIDTGVKTDHEDLKDNIKYNYADPINNIDDDHDGYVDNFRGWDVANNDNDPDDYFNHGTMVAGCASATTDNGKGLAGTGFKCKFLPIKATKDSDENIDYGYTGIRYAAEHGCKVINLSWGGPDVYSGLAQDAINYAAINYDIVVVAAAGNTNADLKFYPAGYDNVLSVASSDTITSAITGKVVEIKAKFGTYNYSVDVCAQGRRVFSSTSGGTYTRQNGSSFSAPLVAGLAGLVRSKYPHFNAQQVCEQIRVSGDIIDTIPETLPYQDKIGKRVNMYRALTDTTSPAVRLKHVDFDNGLLHYAFAGDTVRITGKFVNYLSPTSSLTVKLTSQESYVTVLNGTVNLNHIGTLDTVDNSNNPFIIVLSANTPFNRIADLRLEYSDAGYWDQEHFFINVNPNYLTLDSNNFKISIGGNGRFGFVNLTGTIGDGISFQGNDLSYESGFMLGTDSSHVSDCVRSITNSSDFDFTTLHPIRFGVPYLSSEETYTIFMDTSAGGVPVEVTERAYAFTDAENLNSIIVEYTLKNKSSNIIPRLFPGIFTDWDIEFYNANFADYDTTVNLGYTYCPYFEDLYGGMVLLTEQSPSCYSMENANTGGSNINPNSNFSTAKKFTTLKSGLARLQAGQTTGGDDVSQVIGARIDSLSPGDSAVVAFAFVGGYSFDELKIATENAKLKYKQINTGLVAVSDSVFSCDSVGKATIAPDQGSNFRFYSANNTIVSEGSSYSFVPKNGLDTIYVSSIDSIYESSKVTVIARASTVNTTFSASPSTLILNVSNTATFDVSSAAKTVTWMIEGNSIIGKSINYQFDTAGIYSVSAIVEDNHGCADTIFINYSVELLTSLSGSQTSNFQVYPVPSNDFILADYTGNADVSYAAVENNMGTELLKVKWDKGNDRLKIQINDLAAGIYFIKLYTDEGIIIKKFIRS